MTEKRTIYPNRRARLDAAVGLAMLPVGVLLGLVAALASVALLVAAVVALFWAPTWWLPLWCFAAGTACVWIAVTAIEVVSAFDWRPLPRVVLVAAVVTAGCPIWW